MNIELAGTLIFCLIWWLYAITTILMTNEMMNTEKGGDHESYLNKYNETSLVDEKESK